MSQETDDKEMTRKYKIMSIDFDEKVTMDLVGLDGNAFCLMGTFSRNAKREGWYQEEIDYVLWQCQQGDYSHLLNTLMKHTQSSPDNPDVIEHNGRTYRAID